MTERNDLMSVDGRTWMVRRIGFAYVAQCLGALVRLGVERARLGLIAPTGKPQLTLAVMLPEPDVPARHRRFTIGEMRAVSSRVRAGLPGTAAPEALSRQSIVVNAGETREWVNLGDKFEVVDSFAARAFMDQGSNMRQCLVDLVVSGDAFVARARVGFDGQRPPLPEACGPEASELLFTSEIVALGLREPLPREEW